MIPKKAFPGLSVMTVADLFQLPLVWGKLIFSHFFEKDSMKYLLGLLLWYLLKHVKFTKFVRQNNELFINIFNQVRVGNINDDVEKYIKARFIHESDESHSKDALHTHTYVENETAAKRNGAVLNDLSGDFYTINCYGKILGNYKCPLAAIQAAQFKKQTNTGSLAKLLKLKKWGKSNVNS